MAFDSKAMLCFFLIHKYSTWEVEKSGSIMASNNKRRIGYWVMQSRRCINCGKMQLRVIET